LWKGEGKGLRRIKPHILIIAEYILCGETVYRIQLQWQNI
jgi:hypothetical protein